MDGRDFERLVQFIHDGVVGVHVTMDRDNHIAYVVTSKGERIEELRASHHEAEKLVAAGAIWVASANWR